MDIAGFEKIKVNNAIIVFMAVVSCIGYPNALFIMVEPTLYLKSDLVKILIATAAAGCTQFCMFYICFLSWFGSESRKDWDDQQKRTFIIVYPFICATFTTVFVFTVLAVMHMFGDSNLKDLVFAVVVWDAGFLLLASIAMLINSVTRSKQVSTPPPTNPGTPSQTA